MDKYGDQNPALPLHLKSTTPSAPPPISISNPNPYSSTDQLPGKRHPQRRPQTRRPPNRRADLRNQPRQNRYSPQGSSSPHRTALHRSRRRQNHSRATHPPRPRSLL